MLLIHAVNIAVGAAGTQFMASVPGIPGDRHFFTTLPAEIKPLQQQIAVKPIRYINI
jgi:hypothetical protein